MSNDDAWEVLSSVTHFENRNLRVVTEMVRTPGRSEPRVMDGRASQSGRGHRADDARRKIDFDSAGTNPDSRLRSGKCRPGRLMKMQFGRSCDQRSRLARIARRNRIRLGEGRRADCARRLFFFARIHGRARIFLSRAAGRSRALKVMRTMNRNRFSIAERSVPRRSASMIANNEIRDANTLAICARLLARGSSRSFVGFGMALRNFFKFRELPESETSKPFLEHLEDLRWTIVKMAITLLMAMIFASLFARRSCRSCSGR